jgi:hypothetical protein
MKQTRLSVVSFLAVAALACWVPRAEAVVLAPGTSGGPDVQLFDGGTELDSVYYVVANPAYSVTMASAVYRNVNGVTLDFYYQVTVTAGPDDIRRLSTSAFSNGIVWATDVREITDGSSMTCSLCPGGFFLDGTQGAGGAAPYDRSGNGRVVGFNYAPEGATALNPGEISYVALVRTDATDYEPGVMGVLDGQAEDRVAFQPVQAPEPASLALFALGLVAGATVIRRRRFGL